MQPELFLADALGAAGKPMSACTPRAASAARPPSSPPTRCEDGRFQRVLAVAWEKQAEGNAQWGLGGGKSGSMGAGGIFAPWMRAYISRSGAPEHIGWKVAVKDRLNAVKNPYAHLKLPDITIEKVRDSMMLWDPIHFLESCPSSDGACAIVVADHDTAPTPRDAGVGARRPRCARSSVSSPAATPCGRRRGSTAARARLPGRRHHQPARADRRRRALRAVQLVRADVARGPRHRRPGEGWKMTDDGATEMTGSFPVNPSGGVLSSNPIGASGMIRFAEAALQVQGKAGEHQVEGARIGARRTPTVRWRNTSPWRCCRRRRRPGSDTRSGVDQ